MTRRPERRAFVVGVRPDKREEYLALHRAVWPSVERKLTECNVRNYSIFIFGDILFDEQDGDLAANRNRIGGNLQAFQNTGGLSINDNRIDGNLQCKKNDPAPTGGGNVVQGSKEDQCEGL